MTTMKRKSIQALCSTISAPKPRPSDILNRSIASTTRTIKQPQSQYSHPSVSASISHAHDHFQPIHHPFRLETQDQNKFPFAYLINSLTALLTTTPTPSPSPNLPQLHALLRQYKSNISHWAQHAHANPNKQYTRNLVHEVPGVFNLLILVWTPGKASPVHDHADSHCLMKVLKGELRERRYAIPHNPGMEGPLVKTSELRFGLDKVSYMSDKLGLHEISNPSESEYAVSLHLYTPPNAAMRGCHIYDMHNGESKHVMQEAYDSIRGVVPDT